MGGVGKTQTAREYVHLYGAEYALVAWARGETPADFKAQLAALAPDLDPAIPIQAELEAMFQAARQWFATHGNWLLVVDNAENLPDLHALLPMNTSGRVLLTTRERVPPNIATGVEIQYMDEATGATLLLRRAGILAADAQLDTLDAQIQAETKAVSRELGGLALALDQAGAYMHERPMSPATYLNYYQKRRQSLHKTYRNPDDHASVSITFDLALEQVQQIPEYGPAAVELAQLCAFLAPDPIPDEVFLTNPDVLPDALAAHAKDEVAFTDVCEAATRYALLRRKADPPALTMHRLAQEVLRERLSYDERKAIVERAVLAVDAAFPVPDFPTWPLCARLLQHALIYINYVEIYDLHTPQLVHLFSKSGWYLKHSAKYVDAEPLFSLALRIVKQIYGQEHRDVASALNNLGVLYKDMGDYSKAHLLLEEAVEVANQTRGHDDLAYATNLDNLAEIYSLQNRKNESIDLYKKALNITLQALGPQHSEVSVRLNNLATVYTEVGLYQEAEALLKEAITIAHETIGEKNPGYATCLMNLAKVYVYLGQPSDASPLLQQCLIIYEQAHNSEHPDIARCYFWLGQVCGQQNNFASAADYFQIALKIREQRLGPHHPDTVATLNCLDGVQRILEDLEPSSGLRPPSPLQGEG